MPDPAVMAKVGDKLLDIESRAWLRARRAGV